MESFEDLGLGPELVEALAAEGAEVPTPVQVDAIPAVRRGTALVIRSGPGGGVALAWAAGVLQRLLDERDSATDGATTEPSGGGPQALILAPDMESVRELARSLGRPSARCDIRVAALASEWLDPTNAELLVATPAEALDAVRIAELKLDHISTVVVSEASVHEGNRALNQVETLLELVPASAQRVVTSLPLTPGVRAFIQNHVRKAIEVPIPVPSHEQHATPRGTLSYAVVDSRREERLTDFLRTADDDGPVLIFTRTDDGAADVADFLSLHGLQVGRPGAPEAKIWVATDPKDARTRLTEAEVAPGRTISFDVPAGPDELDLRHGKQAESIVFVTPRELPHLKATAILAHYRLERSPERAEDPVTSALARIRSQLTESAAADDLAPYLATIEPLLDQVSAVELAAGALRLLHIGGSTTPSGELAPPGPAEPTAAPHPSVRGARPFVRLFISIGTKDRVRAGDIVGAIAGEAGVEGDRIGKVDIRDTFSLVEVEGVVAEKVIRALNGTTIRGRSIRADLDRGARRGGAPGR